MTQVHRSILADPSRPTVYAVVVARGCHGAGRYSPRRVYITAREAWASCAKNPRERVVPVEWADWDLPSFGLTRADAAWLGHDLDGLPDAPR